MIRTRGNTLFSHKFGIDVRVGNELTKLAQAIPVVSYGNTFPGKDAQFGDEHYYTGEDTAEYKKNNWYKKTTASTWQSINATSLSPANMTAGTIPSGVKIADYLGLSGGQMTGVIDFDDAQTFDAAKIVGTLPVTAVAAGMLSTQGGTLSGNLVMSNKDISQISTLYGWDDLLYIKMGMNGYLDIGADVRINLYAPNVRLGALNVTAAGLVTGASGLISMWTNDVGYLTTIAGLETDPIFTAWLADEKLSADTTYYVDPAGSDVTGDGSVGTPYQTLKHTISVIPKNLGGFTATISLNDGAYTEPALTISGFYNGLLWITSTNTDPTLVSITLSECLFSQNEAVVLFVYVESINNVTGTSTFIAETTNVYFADLLVGSDGVATNTAGIQVLSGSMAHIFSTSDGGNPCDVGMLIQEFGLCEYDSTSVAFGVNPIMNLSGILIDQTTGHVEYPKVVTASTNTYTVQNTDDTVTCDKATPYTVTLPPRQTGKKITIKNINVGEVTVAPAGADTIDGEASMVLCQWDCMQLQGTSGEWSIV